MHSLANPHRGPGLGVTDPALLPDTDAGRVSDLLGRCPAARETPLAALPALAAAAGIAALHLKDERGRMGLGSFKALGAAHAIALDAEAARTGAWETALSGRVYAAASAGNHGLSVAAGARVFGATAVIYLSERVPEPFAARLRAKGARVERAGATYEASLDAARAAARAHGWEFLPDSSWPGETRRAREVMQGYLQIMTETAAAIPDPPTHLMLQAGVGGMAAALAARAREIWGAAPTVAVVEPEAAPALVAGVRAGRVVDTAGPVSAMGRLDCKQASLIALNGLARDADVFLTIAEEEAGATVARLAEAGFATTPSGAAGLAPLFGPDTIRSVLGLDRDSRVLAILSEGPEAP